MLEDTLIASIMAEGSVGDLTAGEEIMILNDIRANGIGDISAGTNLELNSAIVVSTDEAAVPDTEEEDTEQRELIGNQPIGNISAGNRIKFVDR